MMINPYIIWFLGDILCKIYEISPSKTRYVTRYVEKPVVRTVYRSKIITRPQSIKIQEKQKKRENPVMFKEAVAGLANLGVNKSQAKNIVKEMTSKKNYSSVEELLGDCFSQL